MKTKQLLYAFIIMLIFAGCNAKKTNQNSEHLQSTVSVRHARGFTIQRYESYTLITVRNPWDSVKILENYILIDRNSPIPKNLPDGRVVKVPIEKVAICTAVHAGIWKQLGCLDRIKAVCEPEFIDIREINNGIKNETIANLGVATAIDLEKLIAVSPDALIVSPFENTSYGRFEKTGIPIVQDASYMEDSPLGRAEWIKFEAAFTGKDELAEQIFTKIEQRYQALCAEVQKTSSRPTVFTELKYGQVWYVPGGKSYMGCFLEDAGANYIWKNLHQTGSVPLSFESVYDKAENADFWLIKYNNLTSEMTYQGLKSDYELYANFNAFKKKKIFAINSAKSPYYEVGPMEPDVILSDLVAIFHPEVMKSYTSKYYFPIK